MLFLSSKDMRWQLVELLANTKQATAQELWRKVTNSTRACSLQAIYMHLRSLRSDGVVAHSRGNYSLGLWWAYEFLNLATAIEQNILSSLSDHELLPAPGKRLSWRFLNLIRLDDLWVQLITASFAASKVRTLHAWMPHPWYYFAQREKIRSLYSVLMKKRIRYHMLIGGESFLDRLYIQETPKKLLNAYSGVLDFTPDMSLHETIIGPYIIRVKLDKRISKEIDDFIRSTTALHSMDLRKLYSILNSKTPASISIENKQKKAEKSRAGYDVILTFRKTKRIPLNTS